MASLSTMPADICLCISDSLSQADRNVFGRTGRCFYYLISPRLYRHNVQHNNASALWWAIERGCRATAEPSLNQGADINACKAPGGDTLFTRTVELRTEAEHNVNHTPHDQSFRAQLTNLDSLITLFLERDIDINAQGLWDQTAFHTACGIG